MFILLLCQPFPGDINYLVLEYSRSLSGFERRAGFFTFNHTLSFITVSVQSFSFSLSPSLWVCLCLSDLWCVFRSLFSPRVSCCRFSTLDKFFFLFFLLISFTLTHSLSFITLAVLTLIHFIASLKSLRLFDQRLSRNGHFAALSAVPGDINCVVLQYSRSLSGSETRAGFFTLNHSLSFITAVYVIMECDNQPLLYWWLREHNKSIKNHTPATIPSKKHNTKAHAQTMHRFHESWDRVT